VSGPVFDNRVYQAEGFTLLNAAQKHPLDFSKHVAFEPRSKAYCFFVVWIDLM
jgi:hypothetical protein